MVHECHLGGEGGGEVACSAGVSSGQVNITSSSSFYPASLVWFRVYREQ